jgi:LysR family hydrogen peroxide-inducible transcriptional activator
MNLRDLQYLVAVADHRHFGRAAEACFVSQPTLSTQIKKLEAELGVSLVERTSRQVMLTEAGVRVVEQARSMLAKAHNIERIAKQAQDPEAGTLRLGLFPTIAPYLLAHVVPTFRERFPDLELLLVEEKTDVLLARLRSGALDAAVLALPVPDDGLHTEPMFDEDFVLAVPAEHPLARSRRPVPLADLRSESVLLLEEGHCLRQQALDVCQLAGVPERSDFRATSLETLRQMVSAGVGVTLLPALATKPPVPQPEGVVLVPLAEPVPQRHVGLCWRRSSAFGGLLTSVAESLSALPAELLHA